MGFRDRFYTPKTARAILSWRILRRHRRRRRDGRRRPLDPVAIGGRPRCLHRVGARRDPTTRASPGDRPIRSERAVAPTDAGVAGRSPQARRHDRRVSAGPLRKQLEGILAQLDHGLDEAWRDRQTWRRHRRLGPTARPDGPAFQVGNARNSAPPPIRRPRATAAVEAVESQLASADRLKRQSDETAATLGWCKHNSTRWSPAPVRCGRHSRFNRIRQPGQRPRAATRGTAPGRPGDDRSDRQANRGAAAGRRLDRRGLGDPRSA